MENLKSILLVADRTDEASGPLAKAVLIARHFGAKVELFLCDSEHAYEFRHAYDQTGVAQARQACLADGHRYLETLRSSVSAQGIEISIDVTCESPLYEGIVHKILKSTPDLVIKNASGALSHGRFTLDSNDWQLMRACPTTLMLTRGHAWHPRTRVAAMVDVSRQETPGLARDILAVSQCLALGCNADVDVVYSEPADANTEERAKRARLLTELVHGFHIQPDRVHVLSGDPEKTFPTFAAGRYDVLVLGALTHREGLAPLVGTLTSSLFDTLDSDFILVKPGTYRCPIQE